MRTAADAQSMGFVVLGMLGDAGTDWHLHVWENLGWHANLVSPCGRLKLYWSTLPSGDTRYVAYLGDTDTPGGYWTGTADTPQAAIAKVVAAGRAELKRMQDLLHGL